MTRLTTRGLAVVSAEAAAFGDSDLSGYSLPTLRSARNNLRGIVRHIERSATLRESPEVRAFWTRRVAANQAAINSLNSEITRRTA